MKDQVNYEYVARIWWAYVWRKTILTLLPFILVALAGFTFAFLRLPLPDIKEDLSVKILLTPLVFFYAIFASIFPIRLILGKDFGDFKLVIQKKKSRDSGT